MYNLPFREIYTMIEELKVLLIEVLPHKRAVGICALMDVACASFTKTQGELGLFLIKIMSGWSKFSGDRYYPVPSGTDSLPGTAYFDCIDFYDLTTEYGRLRIELVEYLIVELTKLIEKEYDE